jgi:hypothetical protein
VVRNFSWYGEGGTDIGSYGPPDCRILQKTGYFGGFRGHYVWSRRNDARRYVRQAAIDFEMDGPCAAPFGFIFLELRRTARG